MTNFKQSLLAVAAMTAMAGAVDAQTVSYGLTSSWGPTIQNNQMSGLMSGNAASFTNADGRVVFFNGSVTNPTMNTTFQEFNRSALYTPPNSILRTTQTTVYCNNDRNCFSSASQTSTETRAVTLTRYSIAAFRTGTSTANGLTTTWTNQINAQTGQVATYVALPGYILNNQNQAVAIPAPVANGTWTFNAATSQFTLVPSAGFVVNNQNQTIAIPAPVANGTWSFNPVNSQFTLVPNTGFVVNNQNQTIAIPAPVANGTWTFNSATSQFTLVPNAGYVVVGGTPTRIGRTAEGGYVSANGVVHSLDRANAWRLANASAKMTIAGQSFAVYTARSDGARTYFFNGQVVTQAQYEEVKKLALVAEAQAEEAAKAAKAAAEKKDDHVAARTRKTNATVAGAIAINIVAEELFGELLKEHGAAFGASVGGQFENPELNIGVSVDLGKHLGEDFEGVSVNAGLGVESGDLSVGARKTWRVAEYVTVSAGASIGAQGVRVGPELMICNGTFGIGVAMWGPIPIPQVKIFGYTASVVPHLALANAVVGGSSIAYKLIREEMKKPVAVEPVAPAVEPAVEAVDVAAQEFDSEEESID